MKNKMRWLAVGLVAGLTATLQTKGQTSSNPYAEINWNIYVPVDPTPASEKVVELKVTSEFLSTPDAIRRDPSDVIRVGDTYYVWYTKVFRDTPGFPGGWCGTISYASSKDGYAWTEQGQALDKGLGEAWDSAGAYTCNIMAYKGKYYLAYTAMKAPFSRANSQAAIGLAVADSPDGSWKKVEHNPVIRPSETANAPDGFLCDDSVFMVRNDKIWLYYKGYCGAEKNGLPVRGSKKTFLLAATADQPEGPYVKIPTVLHAGHEAALWKDVDSVGSLCTSHGPARYYSSQDGIHFKSMNPITPLKAVGLYRADFEEGCNGARATWGIAMNTKKNGELGLCRFEFVWPK